MSHSSLCNCCLGGASCFLDIEIMRFVFCCFVLITNLGENYVCAFVSFSTKMVDDCHLLEEKAK